MRIKGKTYSFLSILYIYMEKSIWAVRKFVFLALRKSYLVERT